MDYSNWENEFKEWKSKIDSGNLEGVVETMYGLLNKHPDKVIDLFKSITDTLATIIGIGSLVYLATNKGKNPATLQQVMELGMKKAHDYPMVSILREVETQRRLSSLASRVKTFWRHNRGFRWKIYTNQKRHRRL